jgi:hypothetical protein
MRAAALFVLSAALAGTTSSLLLSAPSANRQRSARSPAEIHTVPTAEAAAFAILRRKLRPADAFVAVHAGIGPVGANPALARTVKEPKYGVSAGAVAVVPANGWICLRVPLVMTGAQWWCQTLKLASQGKLIMAIRPPGPLRASRQLLIGLVPDGVRAVTITAAAGAQRSVPVRSNVYDTQIYAPRSISIDLPGSRTRHYPAP